MWPWEQVNISSRNHKYRGDAIGGCQEAVWWLQELNSPCKRLCLSMRKRLWHCIRPLGKPLSGVGIIHWFTTVCASQFTANLLPCHTWTLTLCMPLLDFLGVALNVLTYAISECEQGEKSLNACEQMQTHTHISH